MFSLMNTLPWEQSFTGTYEAEVQGKEPLPARKGVGEFISAFLNISVDPQAAQLLGEKKDQTGEFFLFLGESFTDTTYECQSEFYTENMDHFSWKLDRQG